MLAGWGFPLGHVKVKPDERLDEKTRGAAGMGLGPRNQTGDWRMNKSTLLAALLCAPALYLPAHADEVGDLKAEIAAQKQAAEAAAAAARRA